MVGVQVPAGTVQDGEALGAAAIREAGEETGLDGLTLVRYLGTADYDVRPGRNEVHDGLEPPTAFCFWWMPLTQAHVLAAGMGALVAELGARGHSTSMQLAKDQGVRPPWAASGTPALRHVGVRPTSPSRSSRPGRMSRT